MNRDGEAQDKIDDLTRSLCCLLKLIYEAYGNQVSDIYTKNTKVSKGDYKKLLKFEEEHKEFDRKRLDKAKASAMAKLTDEEKEALGIN